MPFVVRRAKSFQICKQSTIPAPQRKTFFAASFIDDGISFLISARLVLRVCMPRNFRMNSAVELAQDARLSRLEFYLRIIFTISVCGETVLLTSSILFIPEKGM